MNPLPDEVGEVSPSYGDGGVKLMTHDLSGASRHLPALARREEGSRPQTYPPPFPEFAGPQ